MILEEALREKAHDVISVQNVDGKSHSLERNLSGCGSSRVKRRDCGPYSSIHRVADDRITIKSGFLYTSKTQPIGRDTGRSIHRLPEGGGERFS